MAVKANATELLRYLVSMENAKVDVTALSLACSPAYSVPISDEYKIPSIGTLVLEIYSEKLGYVKRWPCCVMLFNLLNRLELQLRGFASMPGAPAPSPSGPYSQLWRESCSRLGSPASSWMLRPSSIAGEKPRLHAADIAAPGTPAGQR